MAHFTFGHQNHTTPVWSCRSHASVCLVLHQIKQIPQLTNPSKCSAVIGYIVDLLVNKIQWHLYSFSILLRQEILYGMLYILIGLKTTYYERRGATTAIILETSCKCPPSEGNCHHLHVSARIDKTCCGTHWSSPWHVVQSSMLVTSSSIRVRSLINFSSFYKQVSLLNWNIVTDRS